MLKIQAFIRKDNIRLLLFNNILSTTETEDFAGHNLNVVPEATNGSGTDRVQKGTEQEADHLANIVTELTVRKNEIIDNNLITKFFNQIVDITTRTFIKPPNGTDNRSLSIAIIYDMILIYYNEKVNECMQRHNFK